MELVAFPSTEAEFRACFADEDQCRAYLARLKWPEGFRCACALRWRDRLLPAIEAGGLRVRQMWPAGLIDRRDDLRTEQEAVRFVVPGDLRSDCVEAGDLGCRAAPQARARQLSNGVVLAAEDPRRHGPAQSRAAIWRGRDR